MKTLFVTILLITTSFGHCQMKDVNVDYMLYSIKNVSKSFEDSINNAMYDGTGTFSRKISGRKKFPKKQLTVLIDTSKIVNLYDNYNGYKLYVANTTKDSISITSYCSSLDLLAQAYIDGEWHFIETHGYMCGNCFWWDVLKEGHYWEFLVPKFTGEIKTRLRYCLRLSGGSVIYSNEIEAGISIGQTINWPKYGSDPIGLTKD